MSQPFAKEPFVNRLVIRRNGSLLQPGVLAFFAWMCGLAFGLASVYVLLGFWLIMPFAGLEMLALAGALYWSIRGNAYREMVTIIEDCLVVERGLGRPELRWECARGWARVDLRAGSGHGRSRLPVGYAGQVCELGNCLTEPDRKNLARRLRGLLRIQPVAAA